MKKYWGWVGIVVGFAMAFGFGVSNPSSAEPRHRKVSDYKTFTEICLDRENLPKATKESIETLLLYPFGGFGPRITPSCAEVGQKIASIVSVYGLSDLDLLRFTPNVEGLSLDGDKIVSDFSGLESLKKLKTLGLSVSSLDKLKNVKLKHLMLLYLTIKGNRLASDVNAFEMMPNFAEFSEGNTFVSSSGINSFIPIPPTLHLKGEILTDISALKSAKGLVRLQIRGKQISDISSIAFLVNLRNLGIFGTKVSDVTPLKYALNLNYLTLRKNLITDISPLGSLVNLRYLDLSCNNIENVEPLQSLTNLGTLFLGLNRIAKIDSLLSLPTRSIDISGNRIDSNTALPRSFSNMEGADPIQCRTLSSKED